MRLGGGGGDASVSIFRSTKETSECHSFHLPSSKPGRRRQTTWEMVCSVREARGPWVRTLVFTFTFLLHEVQDGDGPVRASQEPRDALHHPFHLVLFFRSHSAPKGRRRFPRPDSSGLLRPFGRKEPGGKGGKVARSRQASRIKTTNQLT
jgi:hypothetical protein